MTYENINFSEVRLDFNQSHLKYHTSLDAIMLVGYSPKSELQIKLLANTCLNFQAPKEKKDYVDKEESNKVDLFATLPVSSCTMLPAIFIFC